MCISTGRPAYANFADPRSMLDRSRGLRVSHQKQSKASSANPNLWTFNGFFHGFSAQSTTSRVAGHHLGCEPSCPHESALARRARAARSASRCGVPRLHARFSSRNRRESTRIRSPHGEHVLVFQLFEQRLAHVVYEAFGPTEDHDHVVLSNHLPACLERLIASRGRWALEFTMIFHSKSHTKPIQNPVINPYILV